MFLIMVLALTALILLVDKQMGDLIDSNYEYWQEQERL